MSKGERIWTRSVDIDYESTQAFFDARGKGTFINPLSATMYQDNEPELVSKRDIAEKQVMASLLAMEKIKNVFDMGCGIGRWANFFCDRPQSVQYLGIDFSSSLIEKAQRIALEENIRNAFFQVMSVTDIDVNKLKFDPPYDLIIISGVLIYLNDDDCIKVMKSALSLCAPNGMIYLREPLSKETRLTLKEVYSEELENTYSAIYRSEEEMCEMIGTVLIKESFISQSWQTIFPDELEKRKETRQHFTVLKRGAAE